VNRRRASRVRRRDMVGSSLLVGSRNGRAFDSRILHRARVLAGARDLHGVVAATPRAPRCSCAEVFASGRSCPRWIPSTTRRRGTRLSFERAESTRGLHRRHGGRLPKGRVRAPARRVSAFAVSRRLDRECGVGAGAPLSGARRGLAAPCLDPGLRPRSIATFAHLPARIP
jgi:hypothetical protein